MATKQELDDRLTWGKDARTRMHSCCMGCGKQKDELHVHEIERRSQAPTRWAHRCNYLLLCPKCHGWPFDSMMHARQLAYKLYWDPHTYDLQTWLRLRDPELEAPHRVVQSEVDHYLTKVKEKFG